MANTGELDLAIMDGGYAFRVAPRGKPYGGYHVEARRLPDGAWEAAHAGVNHSADDLRETFVRAHALDARYTFAPGTEALVEQIQREAQMVAESQARDRERQAAIEAAEQARRAIIDAEYAAHGAKLRKATRTYTHRGAEIALTGFAHPCGLLVCRSTDSTGWQIAHAASGFKMFDVPTLAAGRLLVHRIASLTDWAVDSDTLGKNKALFAKLHGLRQDVYAPIAEA